MTPEARKTIPFAAPLRSLSALRVVRALVWWSVADPVAGAGAEGGGAVVAVGELTAVEREAAAADAFGEAVLEALEFGDALVDS